MFLTFINQIKSYMKLKSILSGVLLTATLLPFSNATDFTVDGKTYNTTNLVTTGTFSSGTAATTAGMALPVGVTTSAGSVSGLGDHQMNFGQNTRSAYDFTWGAGNGLINNTGDDFTIFENGSSANAEGFAVSVKKFGSSSFTTFRYEFANSFDPTTQNFNGAWLTSYNLDSFGLSAGEYITDIRISSIFGTGAANPDLVDNNSGEGTVLLFGDAGYGSGFTLFQSTTTGNTGAIHPAASTDADIAHIVGLHGVQAVPEPSTYAMLAIGALFAGVVWFNRRKQAASAVVVS